MSKPAKFVPRSAWGAGPRGATPSSHPIGATKGTTAHWEGPGMGGFPHDVCARKVRTIERFHRGTRGWADIAYNAIVCPHGFVFEGRGVNVMSAANGFTSVNEDWYAVCYLGGTGDPFTDAAREAFREARKWLRSEGNAGPAVNGHRDHKPTQCPGDTIYTWAHSGEWTTENDNEGDDMPNAAEVRAIVREEVAEAPVLMAGNDKAAGKRWKLGTVLSHLEREQDGLKVTAARLEDKVDRLLAAIEGAK